ncbi:hypothetical protein Bca52824_084617 [Brassica carinata]|uniref:Uncharacterized protein n=1 Tax=Brassica carinata TaxID=52824 RepID=A0A8X7TWD8_BRACI|nr:hypothetical protein Bca52824_084617 [Brassica carinata]
MLNPWKFPCRASGASPANLTTGEDPPPPLLPPDPPDPISPLSPVQFPPLGALSPKLSHKNSFLSSSTLTTVVSVPQTSVSLPQEPCSKAEISTAPSESVGSEPSVPASGNVTSAQNETIAQSSQQTS